MFGAVQKLCFNIAGLCCIIKATLKMPKYFYKAKDRNGRDIAGARDAADEIELSKALRQEGAILTSASVKPRAKGAFNMEVPVFFENITLEDRLMMARNLQVLTASGVALPRSLEIIAGQTSKKKLKKIVSDIREEIIKGKNFSETLAKYPKVFSEFFVNMVGIGEKTGNLDKVLKDLAYQMEKEHKLKAKIQGALTYPIVIISVLLMMGFIMISFVVPKIVGIFADMGMNDLPASTRFIMALGDFFSKPLNNILTLVGLVFFIFIFRLFAKTKAGKRALDAVSLRLPAIGPLVKKGNVAGIVGNFSILITSGISVVQAFNILSNAAGNVFFKESLSLAAGKIQQGQKISESLEPYKDLYTPTVIQMISVGEETGETGEILKKLAEFYEEEVSRSADNLTTIIEPVLMLLVGAAVGYFAIAMFSPIYSMLGAIK